MRRLALWGTYGFVVAVGLPAHLIARCAVVAALVLEEMLYEEA